MVFSSETPSHLLCLPACHLVVLILTGLELATQLLKHKQLLPQYLYTRCSVSLVLFPWCLHKHFFQLLLLFLV